MEKLWDGEPRFHFAALNPGFVTTITAQTAQFS